MTKALCLSFRYVFTSFHISIWCLRISDFDIICHMSDEKAVVSLSICLLSVLLFLPKFDKRLGMLDLNLTFCYYTLLPWLVLASLGTDSTQTCLLLAFGYKLASS